MAELSKVDLGEHPAEPSKALLFWRVVFVILPLLFVATLAWRLWDTNVAEQRADGLAPLLEFTTFEGETIRLDDLRGQGVVVNFWASWCGPCREEAVLLEQTWRREKDNGIVFLGLGYLDQEPAALKYLAEYEISYPNGPDLRSQVARRYGVKGVPETFFIAPDGTIAKVIIAPIISQAQMDQWIDQIRPK